MLCMWVLNSSRAVSLELSVSSFHTEKHQREREPLINALHIFAPLFFCIRSAQQIAFIEFKLFHTIVWRNKNEIKSHSYQSNSIVAHSRCNCWHKFFKCVYVLIEVDSISTQLVQLKKSNEFVWFRALVPAHWRTHRERKMLIYIYICQWNV